MIIFLSFIFYVLFTIGFSAYLSFHLGTWTGGTFLWFIFFFFCFNSLFLIMRHGHKSFYASRLIIRGLSFLLGFASYLFLLVLLNDFLLMIPFYGRLFFSCQGCFWSVILFSAAFISAYAVGNTHRIEIIKYLIKNKKGVCCRLVFLSDLHIAPNHISKKRLSFILGKIKTLNPDFVILGGDILEMTPDYFNAENLDAVFQKELKGIPTIAVIGNHEYYGGCLQENIQALKWAGICVLRDSILEIPEKNMTFIGRDDRINKHRKSLDKLLTETHPGQYLIVIDHDPGALKETRQHTVDLQLSGHTHNGQIFPFNLLVKYIFENAYGHKKLDKLDSIVSAGAGVWGPLLRLGARSEIVVIDIIPYSD